MAQDRDRRLRHQSTLWAAHSVGECLLGCSELSKLERSQVLRIEVEFIEHTGIGLHMDAHSLLLTDLLLGVAQCGSACGWVESCIDACRGFDRGVLVLNQYALRAQLLIYMLI